MTAPREIVPERTHFITRRCTQRQHLLRPDATTNAIIAYCLAEAAARFGIVLIAWLVMSNHYHAVVYDPDGRIPEFLEHFHKMVAKALNARWGRWENLWSTEETCVTHLPTAEDVFDKVIYVLSNPLASHLVDRLAHWPGCSSLEHLTGKKTSHARPKFFFSEKGRMPAEATLSASQPPCSAMHESAEAWAVRVRAAVEAKEQALDQVRMREGIRVLGRKAVLATSPFASPSTPAPRRKLRPAVACKDKAARLYHLAKLVAFRVAYQAARLLFVSGDHEVEFPAGTYRLRAWGVHCAAHPDAA